MNAKLLKINVRFRKLHPDARAPQYASDGAAGADLRSVEEKVIPPYSTRLIQTGIAIELPLGFEAQVRPRSGLALKNGITVLNTPGTIDSDYRGEIGVVLHNTSGAVFHVHPGDRIAQLVIAPVVQGIFEETREDLSETERGAGGFGSTGTD